MVYQSSIFYAVYIVKFTSTEQWMLWRFLPFCWCLPRQRKIPGVFTNFFYKLYLKNKLVMKRIGMGRIIMKYYDFDTIL